MEKIGVSYTYSVNRYIEISLEDLAKYTPNMRVDNILERLLKDYIGNDDDNIIVDNDYEIEYCDVITIIDENGEEHDNNLPEEDIFNEINELKFKI